MLRLVKSFPAGVQDGVIVCQEFSYTPETGRGRSSLPRDVSTKAGSVGERYVLNGRCVGEKWE